MNKISKYMRTINLLSSNILKQQFITKHEFLTRNQPLLLTSCTIIRHASSFTNLSKVVNTKDSLIISIKTANQTSDVLEILRLNNSQMTIHQHMQALNAIFILQKGRRTTLSNEELTRSPEFTAMCHKIQNYSRNLELNEILNTVKCLSYLGVSVKSNIMQMLLQLLSKMINEMTLQQITFFQFLLRELSQCPLVDALKLALPLIFETQVQYKLEDTVYWQVESLNYITKYGLSQDAFDFVMSRITKNVDQLDFKLAKSLIVCLYYRNYNTDKYINIINKCLEICINNIEFMMSTSDIEAILSKMVNKYLTDSDIFYNEQFINKIVKHLIKKQECFELMGYIVKKLNKIGYVHHELLDYMTEKLCNDNTILESTKFGGIIAYIASCANANYIPPGFITLKPHILKRLDVQKDILELPWLILTFDLAVLDCWSTTLLEQVFSRNFLFGFLNRDNNTHDYIMLLKLYQATMTLYPGGYTGTLPPKEILEKAIDIYQQNINDFPLKKALEYGLGGNDYVLTGIRSKLGHFIDHLIIMRPGGYSVAFKKSNASQLFLENIIESNENLVIGILLYKPNSYVINLNCLRGPHALINKTIQKLGVTVFPISMKVWDGLMDYEKIPYIMRELKSIANFELITEENIN